MEQVIQIKNLSYRYSNSEKPVLKNINLTVKKGEFILIVGKSGCGKSTLARCLNGLIPHMFDGELEGDVIVFDKNTKEHQIWELARHVSIVFQNPESQFFNLTVEDEVAFGPENFGVPGASIREKVEKSLNQAGISKLRSKYVYKLSDGQKQRVAIAAILSMSPEILVLDEPTSNLDSKGTEEFFKVLEKLKAEGKTIILIEHRTKYAVKHATRVIIMDEGSIVHDGPPQILFETQIRERFGIRNPNWQKESVNSSTLKLYGKPVIKIQNLLYSYGDEFQLKVDNLIFNKGEFVGIMGENGAGKTTLIKLIIGLLRPKRGKIIVNGMDTKSVSKRVKQIGLVLQNPEHQLFMDSVYNEVSFGLVSNNEILKDILRTMDLWELKDNHPHSLSEGQKQRTVIASVLVRMPEVLILDEPTTGMDGYHWKLFINKLIEIRRKYNNLTLILASHDEEMVSQIADRIIIMSRGNIIKDNLCT